MNHKKIYKEYFKLSDSIFNLDFSEYNSRFGIIYTLYSDKYNLIKVGFAKNKKNLEAKLSKKNLILLDEMRGKEQDLNLLIQTLNEFGIKLSGQSSYKYSNILMRHLSILGWPIGKSLYKKRKISKRISIA